MVAAFLALLGLADARRTRHAQIVTDLSTRWDEPMIKDSRTRNAAMSADEIFNLAVRAYLPMGSAGRDQARTEFFELWPWLNVIETIGALNREGAISDKTVFRMWGMSVAEAWDKWEEPVALMRVEARRRGIYRNFEELATKMRKLLDREKYGARI